MLSSALQTEIEQAIGKRILSIAPLSAANNAQIYRLSVDGGHTLVAKVAERGLDTEAYMLEYLAGKTDLPIPKIYYHNEHVIVMNFVNAQSMVDEEGQRHAAELIAAMHNVKSDMYGHDRDTLIAAYHQPNPKTKNWVEFFGQHRLSYMAGEALKDGKVDKDFVKRIDKLVAKLPDIITSPNPPSLIHGDIWGGNILAGRGKILAFLDPAIYYADPEIELAFIRLFHTFNGAFFAAYNNFNPIKSGFYEERADIYALYPLMIHGRLFGLSYIRKAQKILDRLGV